MDLPYVDGFLLAIPKQNLEAYKEMATTGARIWMKHGALDYKECVGEDVMPQAPEGTPADMEGPGQFPTLLDLKEEVAVFSFIVFKSRAHRDEVNAKVMADPEMSPEQYANTPMPFEMSRMYYGGFQTIVDGNA